MKSDTNEIETLILSQKHSDPINAIAQLMAMEINPQVETIKKNSTNFEDSGEAD